MYGENKGCCWITSQTDENGTPRGKPPFNGDGVEHKTFSIKADCIRKIDYSTPNEASENKAAKPAKKKAK